MPRWGGRFLAEGSWRLHNVRAMLLFIGTEVERELTWEWPDEKRGSFRRQAKALRWRLNQRAQRLGYGDDRPSVDE